MNEATGWTDAELARLRMEGLDHLARLQSGEATERDAAEFVAWRMCSRAHEEAFRSVVRLQRLVRVAEGVEDAGAFVIDTAGDDDNVVPMRKMMAHRLSRRAMFGGALAASLAGGMVVLGGSLDMVPSPSEWRADYRTGTGERRLVQLAGGASIELNTRTSIDLRTDMAMPAVELIDGEVMMNSGSAGQVALVAGRGTSTARTGHFNVRLEGDRACVTCITGAMEVRWGDVHYSLRPDDQLIYDGRSIGEVTRGIDAAVLTAWKAGTLIFHNMPMRTVVAEINRYRPGHIFVIGKKLAARNLSGTYYVNRLDEFFSQTQLALGAKVTRLPGNIVVLS